MMSSFNDNMNSKNVITPYLQEPLLLLLLLLLSLLLLLLLLLLTHIWDPYKCTMPLLPKIKCKNEKNKVNRGKSKK